MNIALSPAVALQVVQSFIVYDEVSIGDTVTFWLQSTLDLDVSIECEVEASEYLEVSDQYGYDYSEYTTYVVDAKSKSKIITQQDFIESVVDQEFLLTESQRKQLQKFIDEQAEREA